MTTYKLKRHTDEVFYLFWSESRRSKRKSMQTKDPVVAKTRMGEFMALAPEVRLTDSVTDVGSALKFYMKHRVENLVSGPSRERAQYAEKPLLVYFGKKRPGSLTQIHINEYASHRRAGRYGPKKVGDSTIRRELIHLQAAINFAARNKKIPKNHVLEFELPEESAPKDRWLSLDEIKRLKVAADTLRGPIQMFIRIALATGSRKSAILDLKWDQVMINQGLIDFGKHDKVTRKIKRRPVVPISDELNAFLRGKKRKTNSVYVLGGIKGIRSPFRTALKLSGLSGITPHTLRHTWATHASMKGVPITEIARILGISVQTAERTYAKYNPQYLRTAINSVEY